MFDGLVEELDEVNARVGQAQRELLALIARIDEVDHAQVLERWGARDLAHWLSMRYGISGWKARRWIGAAHALDDLPEIAEALADGWLGIDKVAELCRFATPQEQSRLIRWAEGVSCAAIRHRGDVAARTSPDQVLEAEQARTLSWWFTDEGRRMGLQGDFPAAQGAVIVRAIERMADRIPVMPGEDARDDGRDDGRADGRYDRPARCADALAAICSASVAADPDPDRASVLIHAQADATGRLGSFEVEGGGPIHA